MSNVELAWGATLFLHALMVLYCYLLGSHTLNVLLRMFYKKSRAKYRHWKVDQALFRPIRNWTIAALTVVLSLFTALLVVVAGISTFLVTKHATITVDQFEISISFAVHAVAMGFLAGYWPIHRMDENIRELESLRMVFRTRFSISEIWSMYETLRNAPPFFWEEYKNLADIEVNERTNYKFRNRSAVYNRTRTYNLNRIMAAAAVFTLALTVFLVLQTSWDSLPF